MTFRRTALLLLLTSTALLPPSMAAQGWRLDAAAGRAVHDPVRARVESTVASVGLSYDGGAARWLYASAGTPLDGVGPAWGAGGAGGWLGFGAGPWSLGASLGAHLFGYGAADSVEAGGGATLEVIPTLTWTRDVFRAELSAGFVGVADQAGDSTRTRGGLDSGARLILAAAPGVELSADGRYLRVEGEGWPYAGGGVQLTQGRANAWAFAGQWLGRDSVAPATAFGAGAGYRLDRRTRVEVGFRQEPTDPLYLSTPRRSWSVQVSRALGRLLADEEEGRAEAESESLVPQVADGIATFRLPAADGEAAPAVMGDFNQWQPSEMTRSGKWWTVSVAVRPGAHHYSYRRADGTPFVPDGLPAVDDGFGGRSALLVVP